jgi:hypothetical protein
MTVVEDQNGQGAQDPIGPLRQGNRQGQTPGSNRDEAFEDQREKRGDSPRGVKDNPPQQPDSDRRPRSRQP